MKNMTINGLHLDYNLTLVKVIYDIFALNYVHSHEV